MVLNNAINANSVTPLGSVNGGSGVSSPTVSGILVAQGASPFATKVLTNGQVLVGSTGVDPVAATLTAGSGISITNGAGTISVATVNTPMTWTEVTGTSQAMAVFGGYTANNAGLVSLSLPTGTVAVGDVIEVNGKGAGGFRITQAASQQIRYGNLSTTVGVGGSISSSAQFDCIRLRALVTTGLAWVVVSSVGILDVV